MTHYLRATADQRDTILAGQMATRRLYLRMVAGLVAGMALGMVAGMLVETLMVEW